MKLKLMIDSVGYKNKPGKNDIPLIQIRLRNDSAIKEVTTEELFDYIGKGHTIVPAITIGGAKNENWKEQQLICLDIDNDKSVITPEEAIKKLKAKNIHILGYYHTFSSTEEVPRFRLLLLLDEPCTNKNEVEFIVRTLINFINGDQACKNPSRLFYGTDGQKKEVIIVNATATITLEDVIKLDNPSTNDYNKDNDLMQMVRDFDLLSYMEQDNEVDHTSGDITYFKDCVICGHKDDLRYYHNTNSFYCFGSSGSTGGTIIDYLMATKKLDKAEAIKYFKKELMGLSPDFKDMVKDDLEKSKDTIRYHLKVLGYPIPDKIDWIGYSINLNTGEVKWKLNCPKLVRYISDKVPYVFAKNKSKSGMVKYFYLDNRYKPLDDDVIRGFIKYFIEPLDLHQMKYLNEVCNLLATELKNQRPLEQMNSNENIINFRNGILNLKTGMLEPHSPKYLTTIQLPCNYVEDCPVPSTHYFDNYLNDLTEGDEAIKKLLLQGIGVAISNLHGYRMKQAFFCVGPGNSGKTQIKLLLTELLGSENCTSVDLKDMEKPFHSIELLNARLAGSNDMSGLKISNLEKFKQITGGDYICDSYKNEGLIDFRFNGLVWMLGNRMPIFGGDKGDHVYDRMIIIECNNVIPEERRDKHLLEHLLEEKEYIILQAIKGLKEVIANGYKYDIPESCKKTNKFYRVENDSFLSFMDECVVERPKNETIKDQCTVKVFYETYKEWCKVNNNGFCNTKREMKKMLEDLGKGEIIHTNGGYDYFRYVTISNRARIEYGENVHKDFCADDYSYYEEEQQKFDY